MQTKVSIHEFPHLVASLAIDNNASSATGHAASTCTPPSALVHISIEYTTTTIAITLGAASSSGYNGEVDDLSFSEGYVVLNMYAGTV